VIAVPLRAYPPEWDIRGMTCGGWLTHRHRRRSQRSVGAQRSPSVNRSLTRDGSAQTKAS